MSAPLITLLAITVLGAVYVTLPIVTRLLPALSLHEGT